MVSKESPGRLKAERMPAGGLPRTGLTEGLAELCEARKIDWRWVKSHGGHLEKERADAVANRSID